MWKPYLTVVAERARQAVGHSKKRFAGNLRGVGHLVPLECGLAHRDLTNIEAIGVDELSGRDAGQLLRLARPRSQRGAVLRLLGHVEALPDGGRRTRPAGAAGARPLPHHEPLLQGDRRGPRKRRSGSWPLRARRRCSSTAAGCCSSVRRISDDQQDRLADLVRRNLRTVRAYLLKEDFQLLWGYVSPYWAGRFLDRWCTRTMRSRLDPMKEVARMLRSHRDLILNWFRAKGQFSSGVVEGFNGKARAITKRAYGFRTYQVMEVALYHALGDLPEPQSTHRFC